MAYNGGATLPRLHRPAWGITRQGLGGRIFNAGASTLGPVPLGNRNQAALAQSQAAANARRLQQRQAQSLVAPPAAPAAPGAGNPSASANPSPSPLDAQYYNQVAQGQFSANQQIAGLNAQGANERTALTEYLRRLGLNEPVLEQNSTNRANSQGLLYSGALGRQIGDLQTNYTRNQSDANTRFSQAEAGRQAQISGLQQQQTFDELAARIAAAERASQAAQNAPLIPAPGDAPSAPGVVVPAVGKTGPGRPRATTVRPWGGGLQGLGRRIFNAGQRARR